MDKYNEANIDYSRAVDFKRLEFIQSMIQEQKIENAKILDVGCGNGNISRYLGSFGYDVIGVDISEKAIKVAKKLNPYENVKFIVKSAEEELVFKRKFDVIVCSEVIEHLLDPESFINSIKSSLTANGILIVTVPNGYGPRELLITKPVMNIYKRGGLLAKNLKAFKRALGYNETTVQSAAADLTHLQFFTINSLTKLSVQTGFVISIFEVSNFISDVFPFSLLANRSFSLQKLDCKVADILPNFLCSGFQTVWKFKE